MASVAEHSRRYRARRHDAEIVGASDRHSIVSPVVNTTQARSIVRIRCRTTAGRDWGGVLHRVPCHLFAVHRQHAGTAFAQTRFVWLEMEHDGVLAGRQLRPLPNRSLEVE
jgi:hypothetical protein